MKSIFSSTNSSIINWRIIIDTSQVKIIDFNILKALHKYQIYYWRGKNLDYGYTLINRLLNKIDEESWIYILDDDNELHEKFYAVCDIITNHPDKEVIIFSQKVDKKDFTNLHIRESCAENMKVGGVDVAQMLVKKSAIGNLRFQATNGKSNYTADGIFIEQLYKLYPDKFYFESEVLSNYNSLV